MEGEKALKRLSKTFRVTKKKDQDVVATELCKHYMSKQNEPLEGAQQNLRLYATNLPGFAAHLIGPPNADEEPGAWIERNGMKDVLEAACKALRGHDS